MRGSLAGTVPAEIRGGSVVRAKVPSGIHLGSASAILTVGVDHAPMLDAIRSLGLPVLRVRYPLPACERIRVTRPIVVVVDRTIRAVDVDCVAHVAAEVEARLVEIAARDEVWLMSLLRPIVDAILAEQDVPQRLDRARLA
jgi:hypothetical protein